MSQVTIFHNPGCSTSKYAVEQAEEAGVDYQVVKYMLKAERPTEQQLNEILDKLEDPATDIVRRDAAHLGEGRSGNCWTAQEPGAGFLGCLNMGELPHGPRGLVCVTPGLKA